MVLDLDYRPEDLDRLSDAEAAELLEHLEELHRQKRHDDICEYARYIEVPGTPAKLSEGDRIRLLQRKQAMRMTRGLDGRLEDPEDVALETPDEEEFYPERRELAAHHELILNALQALMEEVPVTGPLANGHVGIVPEGVLLMMPPGSAKSSFGSVVAPSYVMGRWPGTDVIGLSYGADLAKRFGRRVRHICRSKEFGETFKHKDEPVTVTGDNSAVDQWSLTNGSTYRATGILGGVTGNRADLVVCDDPIAGREEAESEVIRDKTNAAFHDDVLTRLKPFGKVIMILTRWHEDDPAGHELGEDWDGQSGLWQGVSADGQRNGRWWLVLVCPMLADSKDDPLGRALGERLWPQWFTERHVQLARGMGERSWMSLYQQKPAASEGVILLKRYWRCWPHGRPEPHEAQLEKPQDTEPPKNWTRCILCYDTAIEDGEDNDYSAMTAWAAFGRKPRDDKRLARNQDGEQQHLILLGGWRAKCQAVDLFKHVEQHIEFYRPDDIVVEKKASGHQLLQDLRRRRPRWNDLGQVHYVTIHEWLPPFPPKASGKVPRAHSAATTLEQGSIWYMPGATNMAVIKECAAAPNGRYLDWFDTVTMMIIWSRNINLLEVHGDLIRLDEEEQMERDKRELHRESRSLYGRSEQRSVQSNAARRLYGRSPKKAQHWE